MKVGQTGFQLAPSYLKLYVLAHGQLKIVWNSCQTGPEFAYEYSYWTSYGLVNLTDSVGENDVIFIFSLTILSSSQNSQVVS